MEKLKEDFKKGKELDDQLKLMLENPELDKNKKDIVKLKMLRNNKAMEQLKKRIEFLEEREKQKSNKSL